MKVNITRLAFGRGTRVILSDTIVCGGKTEYKCETKRYRLCTFEQNVKWRVRGNNSERVCVENSMRYARVFDTYCTFRVARFRTIPIRHTYLFRRTRAWEIKLCTIFSVRSFSFFSNSHVPASFRAKHDFVVEDASLLSIFLILF